MPGRGSGRSDLDAEVSEPDRAQVTGFDATEVARCFELGRVVRSSDGPVARGKQGQVWRLDTTDGSWAVKVAYDEVAEQDVVRSAAFQEAARAAGVPCPTIRRTPEGAVFGEVGQVGQVGKVGQVGQVGEAGGGGRGGAGTGETVRVRVHAWVDLGQPDPLLDPAAVGEVVAAIHRLDVPADGAPDPWSHEPLGAERWDRLVADLTEAGAPFAHRLADLRDELVALEGWIEPPEVLRTCHRDLWADNVLPMADGGLCVIDWEDSGPADPSMELAAVLFEFGRSDPGRARALIAAYRSAGGPATVHRPGHFTMLIAQLGHITATASADWLHPNPRSPARADALAWVSEVFDEPHTRDVLAALLAAVTSSSDPLRPPVTGRRA